MAACMAAVCIDEVTDVFRRHRGDLALGMRTNPVQLANELYARSLISEDTKDWVETARGVSAGDMASRMLSNVEATLRADPQTLEVITAFLEVIWWAEPTLKRVAKEMEEELQEKGIHVSTSYKYLDGNGKRGGEQLAINERGHQEQQSHQWTEGTAPGNRTTAAKHLKPSIQSWISKRDETVRTLHQLAADTEQYNERQQAAKTKFTAGAGKFFTFCAQGFLAPPSAGDEAKTGARDAAREVLSTVEDTLSTINDTTRVDSSAAQRVISKDIRESKSINQKLMCSGLEKLVDESELMLVTGLISHLGPSELRTIAGQLQYGKSRAVMQELLDKLQ